MIFQHSLCCSKLTVSGLVMHRGPESRPSHGQGELGARSRCLCYPVGTWEVEAKKGGGPEEAERERERGEGGKVRKRGGRKERGKGEGEDKGNERGGVEKRAHRRNWKAAIDHLPLLCHPAPQHSANHCPTPTHTESSQLTPGPHHLLSSAAYHEIVVPLTVPILHCHCPHLPKKLLERQLLCPQPSQGLAVWTTRVC